MKLILTSDLHEGRSPRSHKINTEFITKIAQEIKKDSNIKALIIAGDLSSHKQEQHERICKMLRDQLSCTILIVRGNHDYWSTLDKRKVIKYPTIPELNKKHEELYKKYNIHHLQKNPFVIDDVIILGWDGWYSSFDPPSNDDDHIIRFTEGIKTMEWLSRKAHKEFERLLSVDTKGYHKSIIVTHHNPYTHDYRYKELGANHKYLEFIVNKFDYLLTGHTHRFYDKLVKGCRIVNSGSDYNDPKYLILEVL